MSIIAAASSSAVSCRPTRFDRHCERRQMTMPELLQCRMTSRACGDNLPETFRRTAVTDNAVSDLATIYAAPTPRVIAKARPSLDAHSTKFIEMSPFCVLATSGSDGSVDASPRGGNPGFVRVEGPNALLMPDRSGNNRIDSWKNIVEGSGRLQLIFFVPGIDETLRVS